MKTILEWYEELPEPIRSQAIENYNEKPARSFNNETENLPYAVSGGFSWCASPQGHDYWFDIFNRIIEGETLNTPTLEQALKQSIKSLNELKTALDEVRKAIGNESN